MLKRFDCFDLYMGCEKVESNVSNKRIGIITYHGADNYGSVLQAYGLKRFVEKLKNKDTDIINFVSPAQEEMYGIFEKSHSLKKLIKNLYILLFQFDKRRKRRSEFENFRKKYILNPEQDVIRDSAAVSDENYTHVISGSDQIWNILIKDFDDVYMLDFCRNAKRISYAASMGGVYQKYTDEQKKKVFSLLSKYNNISVRENVAKTMLEEIGIENVSVNVDPVFLLSKEEWALIAAHRKIEGDYIFFYSINYDDDSVKIANWYSEHFNMPVYIIHTMSKSYMIADKGAVRWAKTDGVEDFLSLIMNAKFVLSGSFHGTAFSVIFNKPFYRIKRFNNNEPIEDDRVHTLFDKLEISEREIDIYSYKEKADSIYDIDYSSVNSRIENEVQASQAYLMQALS